MSERDPFKELETAAERVARRALEGQARANYEIANRLGLLWVHGVVGVTAGTQMVLWGTASQIEDVLGPLSRYPFGLLAVVGGAVLIIGLLHKPRRSVPLEAVGLVLLALWDFAMTVGLAWARLHQHDFHVLAPTEAERRDYVPGYPVTVYAGLLALLVIHLFTLRLLLTRTPKDGEPDGSKP